MATTIKLNTQEQTSLKAALAAAAENDTIYITQSANDVLTGNVDNNGADVTGLNWDISGGTISGGTAANGGFAYGKKFTADNVLFDRNIATSASNTSAGGGAVSGSGNTVVLTNSTFSRNQSLHSVGGAVLVWGTANITETVFDANSATAAGGALYLRYGALNLYGSTFCNNTSSATGGAIGTNPTQTVTIQASNDKRTVFVSNSGTDGGAIRGNVDTFTVKDADFTSNTASGDGGAIYDVKGTANISGSLFKLNTAGSEGGALYLTGSGSPVISDTRFFDNTASKYGGAVFAGGTVNTTITGSTFSGNHANYGAGLYIDRNVIGTTLSGSTFSGNTAAKDGGAIYDYSNSGKNLTVSGSDFSGNLALENGGALYVYTGTATVSGTEFSGNTANNGGALYVSGKTDLIDVDFIKNFAVTCGGAVCYTSNALSIDKDTLFSGNTAGSGGALYVNAKALTLGNAVFDQNVSTVNSTGNGGGAIFVSTSGSLDINGATLSQNHAYYGGGIAANGITVITGTLFERNTAAANGGAIYGRQNSTGVYGATFSGNSAASGGGAIAVHSSSYLHFSVAASETCRTLFVDNISQNGGAIFNDSVNEFAISGADFRKNYATSEGGALFVKNAAAQTVLSNVDFSGNTAAVNGGAIFVENGSAAVTDAVFTNNVAKDGGAINLEAGSVEISEAEFSGNTAIYNGGGAIYNGAAMTVTEAFFSGNTGTVSGVRGGAIYQNNGTLEITNTKFEQNSVLDDIGGAVYAKNGTVTMNGATFTGNKAKFGGAYYSGTGLTIGTVEGSRRNIFSDNAAVNNGGAIYSNKNLTVVNTDFINNTGANGAAIYLNSGDNAQISDTLFMDNTATDAAALYAGNVVNVSIAGATFTNNTGGALQNNSTMTVSDSSFNTAKDTVRNKGTLTFSGNITLNASLSGDGTWIIAEGTKFTLGVGIDLAGVDFSNASITVDGADYRTDTLIATGVGGAGTLKAVNNKFMTLTLDGTNLWLKEIAGTTITEDVFTGNGTTNMGSGKVETFFATKGNESGIATKISGGKVESNLVGGAYVSAGNTATVDKVELLIGGTAEIAANVYAGGYLYGNAGDVEAAAEAQLTVDEVNITIDGGAVSGNLYGGAHAREYGYALVDTVNITVTAGNHGRIYAGGWAEKGAVSSVGTANVTISGGTVDYLYGGGANADGKTYVTTSNITISGAAEVNTIFMGGRYGYSYVNTVELTFDGAEKFLKRLSGVSSAGMDYAKATTVELATDVTADLIDYVDKFVISENCTLTANDAFYLGNRLENGETDGFTTFDFIAEGEANWTAVAGISDFTNAQFAVNGSEAQLWDGKAAIAIGGYNLTYDANDKTIKLAQITA